MKGSWVKLGATGPDEEVFSPRPESKLWDLTIWSQGVRRRSGETEKKDWGFTQKLRFAQPAERFYPTRSFNGWQPWP